MSKGSEKEQQTMRSANAPEMHLFWSTAIGHVWCTFSCEISFVY